MREANGLLEPLHLLLRRDPVAHAESPEPLEEARDEVGHDPAVRHDGARGPDDEVVVAGAGVLLVPLRIPDGLHITKMRFKSKLSLCRLGKEVHHVVRHDVHGVFVHLGEEHTLRCPPGHEVAEVHGWRLPADLSHAGVGLVPGVAVSPEAHAVVQLLHRRVAVVLYVRPHVSGDSFVGEVHVGQEEITHDTVAGGARLLQRLPDEIARVEEGPRARATT